MSRLETPCEVHRQVRRWRRSEALRALIVTGKGT